MERRHVVVVGAAGRFLATQFPNPYDSNHSQELAGRGITA